MKKTLLLLTTITALSTIQLSAFYNPNTGRWLSRDPSGEGAGGLNLYTFCANNSGNLIDLVGLWGADIHNDATAMWGQSLGYPSAAATAIGTADAAVDGWGTGPLPIPFFQDPSYHFNRNLGGGIDSRLEHYQAHFSTAQAACNRSAGKDDPITAAQELGIALHPLQDWVAHGDFGIKMQGGVIVKHNWLSPQRDMGAPADYPDDPFLDAIGSDDGRAAGAAMHYWGGSSIDYAYFKRGGQRALLTKNLSQDTLRAFRTHVQQSGGCLCKMYFGVKLGP